MKDPLQDEASFLELAAATEQGAPARPAPSRLKSRIFSALVEEQQKSGPLAGLDESRSEGRNLCVFEAAVVVTPLGMSKTANYCRVCHARVLGEKVENAPIFWKGCPYVQFQNR